MIRIMLALTIAILFSACSISKLKVRLENGSIVMVENPENYKYLAGDTVYIRDIYLQDDNDSTDWSISNDGVDHDEILPDRVYRVGVVQ